MQPVYFEAQNGPNSDHKDSVLSIARNENSSNLFGYIEAGGPRGKRLSAVKPRLIRSYRLLPASTQNVVFQETQEISPTSQTCSCGNRFPHRTHASGITAELEADVGSEGAVKS